MDTTITLTEEQSQVIERIKAWLNDDLSRREYKVGGYAGTGKTTVIKALKEELRNRYLIVVCAFTGKAVHVLKKKGLQAQTLHSLMYNVEPQIDGTIKFIRKYTLDPEPDICIVDEAAMLSTDLYRDLQSYNMRLIFFGDPGQLEPIGDNPNLMSTPDYILSKIHRQAEHSPIIMFANHIRQGGDLQPHKKDSLVVRSKEISSPDFLSHDQFICAKNKTRSLFNEKIRMFKKFPPNEISVGDKLICLRNNLNYGVFNGMILFVDEIKSTTFNAWVCTLHDEIGYKMYNIPVWIDPILHPTDEKKVKVPKTVVYCDFGYAITCHKAQGSEWDKVIVWDEYMPPSVWDMKRWRYTAITRASEQLTYNL